MGLLDGLLGDSWEDPKSQAIMGLAQGLLSARGSQGLSAGVGRMNEVMANAKERALRERLLGMQVSNYESEIRARDLAAKKQEQLASMVENLFGGGPQFAQGQSALQGQADQGMPAGPTVQAAQAMPRPGGIGGLSLDDVTRLKMLGGPDLMPAWKVAQEGIEQKPGSVYRMPDGSVRAGPPTLDKGMSLNIGPNGYSAGLVPGALQAMGDLAGAQTRATEGAKADFDLVSVPGGNGDMLQMPRSQAIQRLGGQAPSVPSMSSMPSIGNRQPTPQEMALILADQQRNGVDPTDPRRPFVNLSRQPGQLGRTPSAAEMELAKQQALAPGLDRQAGTNAMATATSNQTVKAVGDSFESAKAANDALPLFNQSRKAIAGGVYAGAGAETKLAIAKGLQSLGISGIDPDKVTNTEYLTTTLGAQLVGNLRSSFGGNPTEGERDALKKIIGSIGTDPGALNKIIDWQEGVARRTVSSHNTLLQSAQERGYTPGFDMAIKPYQPEAADRRPTNLLPTLPTANGSNRGKRARDTETGKIFRSNGLTWVEE